MANILECSEGDCVNDACHGAFTKLLIAVLQTIYMGYSNQDRDQGAALNACIELQPRIWLGSWC